MENKLDEFVNVSLRIRPDLCQDNSTTSCLQVISKKPPILLVLDRSQTYHFDNIFTEEIDQETVYNETVKPLVEYVRQGYSCTVFAYGQTGTGKTYTMGTGTESENEKDAGLIPRTLEQLFAYDDGDDTEINVSVSFIEIYNEKVFDLLQDDNNRPPLVVKGFNLKGFSQETVFNCREAKHFLRMGNKNRHTAGTKQNSSSSRSHAIFTIHCNVRHKDHETNAKLNLVDLAGCESVKKTGNQGSTFLEGVNINKGLLCIGQVMTALSTNSSYIPYRQSIITTILQDSLNKKNFISLMACVNGNLEDCNETIQTLEFAHRVKKMKNKPEVNEVVMQYRKENPVFFQSAKSNATPFKRPTALYQTPCVTKRVKMLPFKTINEPLGNSIAVDASKSSFHMSVSSTSSNVEITQQALSPVIKKYMFAMESSIMDKLENVIKNTLKRPTRSSLLIKEREKENTPNTPGLSWNKIQNEVSKLVKSEIAQLTVKAPRAASSPIDGLAEFGKIRRVLNYESPILNDTDEDCQNNVNISKENFNDINTDFKVPALPPLKKKNSISKMPVRPRRSIRLSLKKINDNLSEEESDVSLESSCIQMKSHNRTKKSLSKDQNGNDTNEEVELRYGKRRCSVRLACKKNITDSSVNYNEVKQNSILGETNFSIENNYTKANDSEKGKRESPKKELDINISSIESKKQSLNSSDEFICESNRFNSKSNKENYHSRKSPLQPNKKNLRIVANKIRTRNVKDTPAGKRLLKVKNGKDSPATSHTKFVLNVLNDGNVKQLEKLHSIGPKTAQQVILFREIKGRLKKISDLSQMPGWHGKKFNIFVDQNFLKKELV